MTLLTLPTDWKGWSICFSFTVAILSLYYHRKGSHPSISSLLLLSTLCAFATLGLLIAIEFIPDDWSANRLTWSAGLLRGYHLYTGENGPSNGFFYPPLGAWFYIPSAFFALEYKAPWLGQLLGWCVSMACVLVPLFLTLRSSGKTSSSARLLSGMFLLCLVLAAPPLRYVATMIHVDAPAFLFIGLAFHLFSESLLSRPGQAAVLGAFLAMAAATKQSTWPFIPAMFSAIYFLFGWRTASKALIGAALTTLVLVVVSMILENPSAMIQMIWNLPLRQASVTPVSSVLLMFLCEGWPILALALILLMQCFHDRNCIPLESRQCFMAKFLITLWMIPFAILTRTKLGADSNHLALPLFCILMTMAPLLSKIADGAIFTSKLSMLGIFYSLSLLLLTGLSLQSYLATNCGWYLWTHNSQQQAMERLHHPHEGLYLPWQILPMLISDGRLYHLDDCLRYENGMGWRRSSTSLSRFLPNPLTEIAIRPFGAPSYLADDASSNKTDLDPMLPGWTILHLRPISK